MAGRCAASGATRWPSSKTSRRRGPVVEFALGPQRVFLLSDPAGIEDVLVTNAASFAKGRALERAKRTLGEGLLTSEGAFHLRQRRLMQPAFHRARIAAYTEAMARTAVAARDTWTAGTPLDLAREMNRLTLTIVADTLFGAEVGSSSDTARVQQAITDVMEMFDLVMLPFAEWLMHLPLPRMRRYRAAQRALDELIYGIVADRRRSGEDRGDLLSMLLHAQDAEGSGGMTDTPAARRGDHAVPRRPRDHRQRAHLDVGAARAPSRGRRAAAGRARRGARGPPAHRRRRRPPALHPRGASPRRCACIRRPGRWAAACCATTTGAGTTSRPDR